MEEQLGLAELGQPVPPVSVLLGPAPGTLEYSVWNPRPREYRDSSHCHTALVAGSLIPAISCLPALDSGCPLPVGLRPERGPFRAVPGPAQAAGGCGAEPACVGKLLAASPHSYSQPFSFYGAGSKQQMLGWLWGGI